MRKGVGMQAVFLMLATAAYLLGMRAVDCAASTALQFDVADDSAIVLHAALESFDFVRLRPDAGVVRSTTVSGMNRFALSDPGKQYALAFHDPLATAPRATGVTLSLPAGEYTAQWVSSENGSVVKTESFTHAGGNKVLQSPVFSFLIGLRLKTAD